MSKTIFNNLISIEIPEGFKELTEVENKRYFTGDLLRVTFQNTEKHVLISLSKSKDSFISCLINNKSVANGALSNMKRNLKEFKLIEEFKNTIFDKPSVTECFSYAANDKDVKQYGELSVFKIKKAFYVVHCLCRLEDKDTYKDVFNQIRGSFKPIN